MSTSVMSATESGFKVKDRVTEIERVPATPAPARDGSSDVLVMTAAPGLGREVQADAVPAAGPHLAQVRPAPACERAPDMRNAILLDAIFRSRDDVRTGIEERNGGTSATPQVAPTPPAIAPETTTSAPPARGDAVGNDRGPGGCEMILPDPEPWHEAVDGDRLIAEILGALHRHVALRPVERIAIDECGALDVGMGNPFVPASCGWGVCASLKQ